MEPNRLANDPSTRGARRLGVAFCALIFLLLYGQFLVGFAPSGGDVINQYLPYQQLIRDAVRQGAAPLWNSLTFCGRPLMADIQVGVLYPPNWLHWFLPLPLSFALVLALHGAWMVAGCWRLGRHWRLAPPAIALGAALYCLNPFFAFKPAQGIVLFIYVGAWWPWLALGASRLAERRGFGRMAALAVALALSLLAGAPQITFYGWLMTLAVGLSVPARVPVESAPRHSALSVLTWRGLWLGLAFIFALGLTAVQTAQTAHFIATSFERGAGGAGWTYITDGSLAPRLFWLLVNPGFLGLGQDPSFYLGTAYDPAHFWASGLDYAEATFYAPLWIPCLLLPLAAALGRRRGGGAGELSGDLSMDAAWTGAVHHRLALLGVAGLFLGAALALGEHSPLFALFYRFFPGFNRFRVPARLMVFFYSGEALLAALVFHALLARMADQAIDAARQVRLSRLARMILIAGALTALALVWIPYVLRQPLWGTLRDQYPNPALLGGQIANATLYLRLSQHALLKAVQVSAGVLAALGVGLALTGMDRPGLSPAARRALVWAWPALVLAELFFLAGPFQLTTYWTRYQATHYPRTKLVRFLQREHRGGRLLWLDDVISPVFDQNQTELFPNRPVLHGLPDARGYDPVNARWLGVWMNMLAGRDPQSNPRGFMFVPRLARPAWLTPMGVETVLSYQDLSGVPGLRAAGRYAFPEGTLTVWRNDAFRGPALAVRELTLNGDGMTVPLADPRFKVATRPEGPNAFHCTVDFPAPAYLELTQSAYDGWGVTVDGRPAPAETLAGTFLATAVPAGHHEVRFAFVPEGLVPGRWISLATLIALLYGLGRGVWARRRVQTAAPRA